MPQTMFEKIWRRHVVVDRPDGYTLLYIDRHLMHDGSAGGFARAARAAACPCAGRTAASARRTTTSPPAARASARSPIRTTARWSRRWRGNAADRHHRVRHRRRRARASSHVVGPEQGITLPGLTLVCGDSHTSTHGALGALAFGIGSVRGGACAGDADAVAAQAQGDARRVDGTLGSGVTAKDVILAIIAKIGAGGGDRARHRVCRQRHPRPVDRGAADALQHVDRGRRPRRHGGARRHDLRLSARRPFAPQGRRLGQGGGATGAALPTDDGAVFDREVTLDGAAIAPMVTWGTSPEDALPITARIPDPAPRRMPPSARAWSARSTTWA